MLGPRLRQGSCRLCLWESNSLWDIFGELSERRNFVRKIQACVNIIVSKDDGLSPLICPNCIYKVELFYDFQTSCKRSDEIQKRYNGLQDDEGAGCDAAEDVLPGMVLHCALSNSNKVAQGPVETIDIKEEPIEDDEASDVVDDEQFEDAAVEIEEVVAVTEDRLAECISATETDQEKEKAEEGVDVASGSCMQLTPPRSPSLTSELKCSASETGGLPEVEVSVEQQQQVRKDGRPEAPSGSADQFKPVEPKPPPPAKYYTQCRFCKKWFQKTGVCRAHEMACAPLHGYAPPPPPSTRFANKSCRCCSAHFETRVGRALHEFHCFRREREVQSRGLGFAERRGDDGPRREVPPPAKYLQQCRFCRKYFRKLSQRRRHEVECGSLLGYSREQLELAINVPSLGRTSGRRCTLCGKTLKSASSRIKHEAYCRRTSAQKLSLVSVPTPATPSPTDGRSLLQCASSELSCPETPACPAAAEANAASLSGGQDVIKCRYCGKGHLKWRSLMTHEYHCRRKVPLRSEAAAQGTARAVEEARDGGEESANLIQSTASKDDTRRPGNRCKFCLKWFRSNKTCKLHEYYCTCSVRKTLGGWYACSFCPQSFSRPNHRVLHERFCRLASGRTGYSAPVSRAEHAIRPERQYAPTGCEKALSDITSTDRQEVISPGVPEAEQKRKKVDTPLCTPEVDSTKETDIWTCQYCDRVFKYHESFRSHVVKCSAIATYRYSMPHDRPLRLFRCPLCGKEFKFRRMLRNHWKVCKVRTSVVAEAAESNGVADPVRAGSERPDGSRAGVTALFGDASSAGEDCEEWHGWPSGQSQTVADRLTDEDRSAGAVDSCGLSCKLCDEHFCSRVLLELHMRNNCIYQRIRSDHAYAQCEAPAIDESTLMRMARIELQRLLLCSCCGDIFTDRRALAEHELSERQKPTEAESPSQYGSEAIHLQKQLKLGKEVDEFVLKLEGGGQQESGCRAGQLTSDTVSPATVTTFENADSRQDSNKNSMLREILCGSDSKQFVGKVEFEKQIKGDVDVQQLESTNGEKPSSNNSVLQECVINNGNRENHKCDPGTKGFLVHSVLKQGSRMQLFHPQYQEHPSSDHHRQLQHKVPTLSEENCREEITRENQCPKGTQSQDAVHSQASKKVNLPQGLCNGHIS